MRAGEIKAKPRPGARQRPGTTRHRGWPPIRYVSTSAWPTVNAADRDSPCASEMDEGGLGEVHGVIRVPSHEEFPRRQVGVVDGEHGHGARSDDTPRRPDLARLVADQACPGTTAWCPPGDAGQPRHARAPPGRGQEPPPRILDARAAFAVQ
jgi:hypothetical protein